VLSSVGKDNSVEKMKITFCKYVYWAIPTCDVLSTVGASRREHSLTLPHGARDETGTVINNELHRAGY
jgi:hypothetical protein